MRVTVLILLWAALAASFTVVPPSPRAAVAQTPAALPAARSTSLRMGPAKDGPFTPLVLLAKVVLGEPRLLKLRGKAISYHSQAIKEFCADCEPHAFIPCVRHDEVAACPHLAERFGPTCAYTADGVKSKMSQGLIKKAKAVGSDLGFLS